MLLSPYFLLGWPPLFMTNTLTLHVFCVYFLFPFSLFLCLLFVWVLTSAKGIPLHSAAMPIAISYTPEQCQRHLLTLTTVFAVLAWGVDAAAGWNPRTNLGLSGELLIACLWGEQSHHHCFTKFFLKKSLSLSQALSLPPFLSLSTRLSNMLLSKKKKKTARKPYPLTW